MGIESRHFILKQQQLKNKSVKQMESTMSQVQSAAQEKVQGGSGSRSSELHQEVNTGRSPPTNLDFVIEEEVETKKRKVSARSPVWLNFEKFKDSADDRDKATCNYCKSILVAESGNGTSSLWRHLKKCQKFQGQANKQMKLDLRLEDEEVEKKALWIYDEERCRKALAFYVVIDEIPFRGVEAKGFRTYSQALCPQFKIPSRTTIAKDIIQLHGDEKLKLKLFLKENTQRISITTDTWTSNQHVNYMSLTAHVIDDKWKLHKMILCFRAIDSHKGVDIGNALERCIKEWGITKLFAIVVDNATTNDVVVSYLKSKMDVWKTNILGGKYLHVRCVAHIINLVVHDGLKGKDELSAVDCIRGLSSFIRSSTSRYQDFCKCVESEGIKSKKMVCLDVPNRWNSTYLMLDAAISLEGAFLAYEFSDESVTRELGKSGCRFPTDTDWQKVKLLHKFLSYFYQMTNSLSGSRYVTTHLAFHELTRIEKVLFDALNDSDQELVRMSKRMKEKYDKYFGSFDKMNKILCYSVILDPRVKLGGINFTLDRLYAHDSIKRDKMKCEIRDGMIELFHAYQNMYGDSVNVPTPSASSSSTITQAEYEGFFSDYFLSDYHKELNKSDGSSVKSELDLYLAESVNQEGSGFDILYWWSKNCERFPILARIARDILAVPVTTVASESAFSTGGRVVDDFRSKLLPKTVDALVCTQDWLRGTEFKTLMDEDNDVINELEKGFAKI